MKEFLQTIVKPLAQPLAWLLSLFFDLTHSYGFAVILLTGTVMVLVMPLTIKGTRSMMAMQKFQPEIRRLQAEFKGDRPRLNEELLAFYRENGINPMGSCFPLLVQAPVFIGLYQAIKGITNLGPDGTFLPKYVSSSSALYHSLLDRNQMLFLGIDLSRSAAKTLRISFVQALPYLLIIGVATATSYVQQRQVAGRSGSVEMNPTQKTLMRVMPLTMLVFSFSLPAALGMYLATSNCFRVAQQWYISRALYGKDDDDVVATTVEVPAKPAKPVKHKIADPQTPAAPRVSGRVTQPKPSGPESKGADGGTSKRNNPADERAARKRSSAGTDGASPGANRRRQPFGPGPASPGTNGTNGTNDDKRRG